MRALLAAGQLADLRIEKPPQTGAIWWLPLGLAIAVLLIGVPLLTRAGARERRLLRRPADTLARITGLPAWSAAGISIALWALVVAVIGFTWDVAWHADLGRDQALFTPPHTMILIGLAGIGIAALAAIALATVDAAEVGLSAGRLRIPWSSLPMGLMALGAIVGFPLDDYWHATYGIDVTMWSPTHLLMIGGASLTPIAAWLMLAEARGTVTHPKRVRLLSESLAAATLLGLSTFQLEFDLGVPQWQALYQPALMAVAMGVALIAAREALGPGGALRATIGFLVSRGLLALLVGPVFGLSVERFPLYLAGALCVEAVYLAGKHLAPAARALLSGLLIGTVGVGAEWGWTQVWGLQPWQPRLLQGFWVVLALALTCAVLGAALGRAVAGTPLWTHVGGVALAFVALVALLAVPYPRTGSDTVVSMTAIPAGPQVPAITRDGLASFEQDMTLQLSVTPATGIEDADWARLVAWQGGDIVLRPLHRTGAAGSYTIDGTFPTGGTWKSLLFVAKGAVVEALPVDFPSDPQYGLAPIPAPVAAPRTMPFEPASVYLTRESHGGSALPAILAYSALALVGVVWSAGLLGVGEAMRRRYRATLGIPRRPRPA